MTPTSEALPALVEGVVAGVEVFGVPFHEY